MRFSGTDPFKHLEMLLPHHQRLPVLFEKKTHLRSSGCIVEQPHILQYPVQVEEFDRLQRARYLFPASRKSGTIKDINQGTLQTGKAQQKNNIRGSRQPCCTERSLKKPEYFSKGWELIHLVGEAVLPELFQAFFLFLNRLR